MSSSGAGGGVVSIVHPIHIHMTSAANTKRKNGIDTANQLNQSGQAGNIDEMNSEKNVAI